MCDDVYVEIEDTDVLKNTINFCFRGNNFIKNYMSENRLKQPIQKQMGLDMYLDANEVKSLLEKEISNANSIKFYGMGAISYQDQMHVLAKVHDMIKKGKNVSIEGINHNLELISPIIQSTLGQGINNADVFIFWNTDPTQSHPKLFGKLLFSRGMFRLSGKEMKKFIVVQKEDSDLTRLKDILIDFSQQTSSQLINEFKKLMDNKPLDTISLGNLSIENLRTLKTYLEATEYGLIVCDTPISNKMEVSELNELLQSLNSFVKGRFAFMPLTFYPNEFGLYAAVSKIFGEDLKNITESSDPADLAIIFGGEYLRDENIARELIYAEKKTILFDNFKSNYSKKAIITIPFSIPGIECDGTAIRTDGVDVDLIQWKSPEDEVKSIIEIFDSLSF
jgi:formylmethanofuran dehydrogenase subunit B